MLEKVNAYLRDKIHLPPFLFKERYGKGICSIEILPRELLICYMRSVSGELQIQLCESVEFEKQPDLKLKLSKLVKAYQLEGINCSWILSPNHYQLIMTEALPVSASEFQTSIRWKIKESLAFSVEDAVLDRYEVPELKTGNNKNMIIVVVARNSYLQPYLKIINESKLKLGIIDTTELALHNLTAMYEEDDKTSALIYIQPKHVQLLITYHQKLYFSRSISTDLGSQIEMNAEGNQSLDQVILEIQRSFDYFQSQWRLPLPARIFISGVRELSKNNAEIWTHKLSAPVQLYDINNVLSVKNPLPVSAQGKYLPILGGVLRGYVEVHETTD